MEQTGASSVLQEDRQGWLPLPMCMHVASWHPRLTAARRGWQGEEVPPHPVVHTLYEAACVVLMMTLINYSAIAFMVRRRARGQRWHVGIAERRCALQLRRAQVLEAGATFRVWKSLYFYGHLMMLAAMVLPALVKPRKVCAWRWLRALTHAAGRSTRGRPRTPRPAKQRPRPVGDLPAQRGV